MKKFSLQIVLIVATLMSVAANAEIYRWVDEGGRVHYSSRPSTEAQAEDVTTRVQSTGNYVSLEAVAAPVDGATVTMFTTTWCKVCKMAKAYLNEKGIAFVELDVEHDEEGKRRYHELNGKGVPITLIGQQKLVGFSAAKMEQALKQAKLL